MASEDVTSAAPVELVVSERGGFGLGTDFNVTVEGEGKIYVDFLPPTGANDAAKAADLKANGLPLTEGLYADGTLIAGEVLWAVADTGTVEVRVIRKGSK